MALKNTGNVFSWEAIDRLCIKAKSWKDLVNDEPFTRADIITLQNPQSLENRNMSNFKHIESGEKLISDEEIAKRKDPLNNINAQAIGSSERILKAEKAVAALRARTKDDPNHNLSLKSQSDSQTQRKQHNSASTNVSGLKKAYNTASYSTGASAASLTSTALTPVTRLERAIISDEDYLLSKVKIKIKGYAQIQIKGIGNLNIELHTDYAPRAVYNFVNLAKKGYYQNCIFHRNIKNFMLQGGDPTGTGRGGESLWGKNFRDEVTGPLTHDARGVVSMANKGKNTNSSQL